MSIEILEAQLKKRWAFSYQWNGKQNNTNDQKTNWIYKSPWWKDVEHYLQNTPNDLHHYALNRWYNFWSAQAVESMIVSHKMVRKPENKKDKQIDFFWNDIPFDHKTTIFPKGFGKSLEYAKSHEDELIAWLYENQSQEQRCHYGNRLFLVVYDSKQEQHWKCKAELTRLYFFIHQFFLSFCLSKCPQLMHNGRSVYTPIIWAIF